MNSNFDSTTQATIDSLKAEVFHALGDITMDQLNDLPPAVVALAIEARRNDEPVIYTKAEEKYGFGLSYRRFLFNSTFAEINVVDRPGYFTNPAVTYQLWGTSVMITSRGDGEADTLRIKGNSALFISELGAFRLRALADTDSPTYGVNEYRGLFLEDLTPELRTGVVDETIEVGDVLGQQARGKVQQWLVIAVDRDEANPGLTGVTVRRRYHSPGRTG